MNLSPCSCWINARMIIANGTTIFHWEIIRRKSFYNLLHIWWISSCPLTISTLICWWKKRVFGFPFGFLLFSFRSMQLILLKFNSDTTLLNCSIQSTCPSNLSASCSFQSINLTLAVRRVPAQIDFKRRMKWDSVEIFCLKPKWNGNEANDDSIMQLLVLEKGKMLYRYYRLTNIPNILDKCYPV